MDWAGQVLRMYFARTQTFHCGVSTRSLLLALQTYAALRLAGLTESTAACVVSDAVFGFGSSIAEVSINIFATRLGRQAPAYVNTEAESSLEAAALRGTGCLGSDEVLGLPGLCLAMEVSRFFQKLLNRRF
jgi:hypothetical protein